MMPSVMPASAAPKKPSKGPPPLPTSAVAAPLPHETAVEAMFFLEGIDGRAESLPSAEAYAPAIDENQGADADSTSMSRDSESFEAKVAIEDPARTRRRKAARIGVAYGAIVLMMLAAAAAFSRPRAIEPSAMSSASPALVAKAAPSPVASPIVATRNAATAPLAAVPPARTPVRAMTASMTAAAPASPRAVVGKGAPSTPAKRAASSSPKDARERAKHTPAPSAPRASSARKRP